MAKAESTKTFHRWTPAEDKKLVEAIAKEKAAYESIGQPGGIARDVFWGQIPGRISVLATPLACAMRYRTLTSKTEWAEKRRKGTPARGAQHGGDQMLKMMERELRSLKEQVSKLASLWEPLSQ